MTYIDINTLKHNSVIKLFNNNAKTYWIQSYIL